VWNNSRQQSKMFFLQKTIYKTPSKKGASPAPFLCNGSQLFFICFAFYKLKTLPKQPSI